MSDFDPKLPFASTGTLPFPFETLGGRMMTLMFLIIALIPAVFIVDGLIEGEVQAKGGSYRRAEDPGWFWGMIGMYAAMFVWIVYQAADLALS